MAKKKKSLLVQSGITEDGKAVFAGAYSFFETEGLPLDVIFNCFEERGWVPDWIDSYHCAQKAGMKHDRILSKLEESISDSFGKDVADHVIVTLDHMFKDNND